MEISIQVTFLLVKFTVCIRHDSPSHYCFKMIEVVKNSDFYFYSVSKNENKLVNEYDLECGMIFFLCNV